MRLKALASEFIGTAFLLAGVVGSGIMAERLSEDVGVVLLANAAATAGVLLVIIYIFGPVSGAHFNPVVTLAEATLGDRRWAEVAPYIVAQLAGGVVGTIVANLMFDLDAVNVSTKARDGSHLWLAEVVATYGLVLVVFMLVRSGRASWWPGRWPPTSARRTGSRPPPPSPILRSLRPARFRTLSRASSRPRRRCSW